MTSEVTLDKLLKEKKISQITFNKASIAQKYIERKYNLKAAQSTEWNSIMNKINSLNIPTSEKQKAIKDIYEIETQKSRKKRSKQSIHDYESISIIGRGAFGEVHVCREKKTGDIVAIKKIRKDVLITKNQVIHTRNEQEFLSRVKSIWIVDLKASFQEDDYLYLVMEYLPGGDLMNLLIQKDIFTEEEARFYTAELVLAIESIHKYQCIHRDIKPDNVLIGRNGHIKLSDFGLAKVSEKIFEKNPNFGNNGQQKHTKNYSCVGTAYYVAPEVLSKQGYGPEIDWWSVGVIFFEMLVGYAPFCSKETSEVCYKVTNWPKYLKIPQNRPVSKEAEDLIKKMINNPSIRLGKNGAEEIKRHPFFKGVDWENIQNTTAPFIPNLRNDYDVSYFETFDTIDPFYPPTPKIKKRKDADYIGYTYKNDDVETSNYAEAIQIIDSLKGEAQMQSKKDSDNDNDNDKDNGSPLNKNEGNDSKEQKKVLIIQIPIKKMRTDVGKKIDLAQRGNVKENTIIKGNNLSPAPSRPKYIQKLNSQGGEKKYGFRNTSEGREGKCIGNKLPKKK